MGGNTMDFKNSGVAKGAERFAAYAQRVGPVAKWAKKTGPGMKYAQKPVKYKTHALGRWVKK